MKWGEFILFTTPASILLLYLCGIFGIIIVINDEYEPLENINKIKLTLMMAVWPITYIYLLFKK